MEQQPKQSYTDFMQEPSPAPSSPPPGSPSRAPRSSEQKQVITIVAVLAVVVAFVLVSCLILFHNNSEAISSKSLPPMNPPIGRGFFPLPSVRSMPRPGI